MAIEEGLRGIKVTSENDKDNHHIHNGWHTRLICNSFMAKGALLCATPFAKSVCEGHPIQGFMASDKTNFIQKITKRRERLDANTLLL